ncbi:MAG: hypothetical protein U5L45_10665 [Saprospiraceae bacterium]|nr:hypothetical protein [Saprospiraceae bacterium]
MKVGTSSFSLRSKIAQKRFIWGERVLKEKNRRFFSFKNTLAPIDFFPHDFRAKRERVRLKPRLFTYNYLRAFCSHNDIKRGGSFFGKARKMNHIPFFASEASV